MPYNNTNKITDKEFYTGCSRLTNVTPATIKHHFVDGIVEFIIRELQNRGNCRIPYLGTITLQYKEQEFQQQTDPKSGEKVIYEVPARVLPVFTPCDSFINDINGANVTKLSRKREKHGRLTKRDLQREARNNILIEKEEKARIKKEEDKNNFSKFLNSKKHEI